MPLLEYRCEECAREFEILTGVGRQSEPSVCPDCGSSKVEKLFSTFSARASASAEGPCGPTCPPFGPCGASVCPSAN